MKYLFFLILPQFLSASVLSCAVLGKEMSAECFPKEESQFPKFPILLRMRKNEPKGRKETKVFPFTASVKACSCFHV